MRKRALLVAALLSWIAIERTDFSPEVIAAPLVSEPTDSPGIQRLLSQNYRYLGQGRQSYVFVSEEGETVLKFFNRRYMEMPWYSSLPLPLAWKLKERLKRAKRRDFYLHSYLLAEKYLKEETGILHVHLGRSKEPLGSVVLVDRASRHFSVDLDQVAFVLQKRGEPLYPALNDQNLEGAIEAFLKIIAKRIQWGIADADHDVEHNFGSLNGRPFHLDPGRFSLCAHFDDPARLEHEWWSSTHRFRDWLEEKHPEFIPFFDAKKKELFNTSSASLEGHVSHSF